MSLLRKQLGALVYSIGKLCRGPPKAGVSPQETISKFFLGCLVNRGAGGGQTVRENQIPIDAYVCLLNAAKAQIGGWKGFVEYWSAENNRIIHFLEVCFFPEPVTATSWKIDSIELTTTGEHSCRALLIVSAGATSGVTSPGVRRAKSLARTRFQKDCELECLADRWYLPSPYWSAKPLDGLEYAEELSRPSVSRPSSASGQSLVGTPGYRFGRLVARNYARISRRK